MKNIKEEKYQLGKNNSQHNQHPLNQQNQTKRQKPDKNTKMKTQNTKATQGNRQKQTNKRTKQQIKKHATHPDAINRQAATHSEHNLTTNINCKVKPYQSQT